MHQSPERRAKPKQVSTYLGPEVLEAFEKKRKRLSLSYNQMLKLCVMQSLGLITEEVPEYQIESYLRGK